MAVAINEAQIILSIFYKNPTVRSFSMNGGVRLREREWRLGCEREDHGLSREAFYRGGAWP
jgi:hypothetical protein